MKWNYDISQAPRGHTEEREVRLAGGKSRKMDVFIPQRVIVASRSCNTVTVSRWIPPEGKQAGRWNMLGTGEEPLAWMPWPDHPRARS